MEEGKPTMFYQEDQYLISFLRRVTRAIMFEPGKRKEERVDAFNGGVHESYLPGPLEDYLDLSTGRVDKNGAKIYGGDIMVLPDSETTPITDDGRGPTETANHLCPVVFKNGAFGLDVLESGDTFSKGFASFENILGNTGLLPEDLEIIGNIHENSELLK